MKNKFDLDVINSITMLLQMVLLIYVFMFGIIGMFEKELLLVFELLLGILMIIIAYNNHKIYKRKYMTYVYLGLGITVIVTSLFV